MATTLQRPDVVDRTKALGASEIADVLGLGKGSAYEVWAKKMGQMEETPSTPEMTRGLRLEPIIREDLAEELGIPVEEVEVQVRMAHPDFPFLAATLDAMVRAKQLAEEWKTAGHFAAKEWGRPGTHEVPARHALQNTYQTAIARRVLGIEFTMRLRLVPVETMIGIPYPLQYDPELGEMLIEAGAKFWKDHVETGIAPKVSGTTKEAELFKKLYARSEPGVVLDATPQQEAWVLEAMALKRDVAKFEKALTKVELQIKESMGDASKMVLSDGREVRWQTSKGVVSWKKVAEELNAPPELILKHTPEVGARPFVLPKDPQEEE